MFLQAWHMGRATHSSFLPGNAKPISASATAIKSETYSATCAVALPQNAPHSPFL